MTYQPAEFVSAALAEARNVMAQPDLYSDADLSNACAYAVMHGDWMDVDRATKLQQALRIEAMARDEHLLRDPVAVRNAAIGLFICWLGAAAAIIWFGPTLAAQLIRWGGSIVAGWL